MAQQEVKIPQGASYGTSSNGGEAPLPEGASFGAPTGGQGDPNATGVLGAEQTAPNAGLAPPAGDNKSIVPARSVGLLRTDFYDSNFNPVTETNKPRKAGMLEKAFTATGGQAQQGMEELGVDPTNFDPNATLHPLKAINHFTRAGMNWAAPLLPSAIATAPLRTGITLAAAYGGAKLGEKGSSLVTDDPDIQELASNLGGLAAGGVVAHKLFPAPPSGPTSNQNKAFNSLHPENASNTLHGGESVLPEILQEATNSFSKPGLLSGKPVVKVPKGEEGVRLLTDIAQKAIDTHDATVHSVADQFNGEKIDLNPAAQAALKQITPEMIASAKTNPGTQRVIDAIKTIAQENSGEMTMKDAFDRKHRYNDNLSAELGKSEAAQDVSPQATQALRNAANGLRDAYYQRLSDLSGQDVRPLAQKEGALIEAKAGLDKSGTSAVKGQGNDTGANPRLSQINKAAQRVQLTRPASIARALPEVIQAIVNPEGNTPIGKYVKKTKRVLSSLPERTSGPQVPPSPGGKAPQQESLPFQNGPLFDIQQTPTPPDLSNLPAIPTDSGDLLKPGKGRASSSKPSIYKNDQPVAASVTPSQMSAMEKAPYGGFKVDDGSVQDYGRTRRRLPTEEHPELNAQLPDIIAEAVGLKKPLPPALPPASSIQLGPSSLDTKVGATKFNTPNEAATFQNQAAQKLFGKNYNDLTVPERLQTLSEGAKLQDQARAGKSSVSEDDRGAGLKARKSDSVVPERGKGFVTNEAAERRSLPHSTQAQLLTSELNEIRRSINESTTPEEKKYNEQRFIMKQEEVNKLGLPPELNNAIQASPKAKGVGK